MKRALIVGIENYPGGTLKGCAADATAVYKMLLKNENGTRNFDAEIYTGEIKTQDDLFKRVENLFSSRNEIALFYFSGHGAVSDSGSYLVTPDWKPHDKGVPVADLINLTIKSNAATKIIILDCCHAGAAGKLISGKNSNLIGEDTIILASSRDNEVSKMVNGHSVFTNLLLEALQGGAADLFGNISPAAVYAMIDQSLGAIDQRPVFKVIVDKLVSLRTVRPPIEIEDMHQLTSLFPTPDTNYPLNPENEQSSPTPDDEAVRCFKILQRMNRINLVIPVGEIHMYWAAMNSKACRLTSLGKHYWRMCKDGRF